MCSRGVEDHLEGTVQGSRRAKQHEICQSLADSVGIYSLPPFHTNNWRVWVQGIGGGRALVVSAKKGGGGFKQRRPSTNALVIIGTRVHKPFGNPHV